MLGESNNEGGWALYVIPQAVTLILELTDRNRV